MSDFGWVVLITFIAGVGGTGIGGVLGAILKKDNDKIVSLLLSFAGGVMLAITCFDLIPDAVQPTPQNEINIFFVILGIALGYLVIYFLNHLIDKRTNKELVHIDEEHPKTADDLGELIHSDHYSYHASEHSMDRRQLMLAGIVMVFAIALHNIPEGMVIGSSMANGGIQAGGAAVALAIVIGLHNIPEGMAVSLPLVTGGTSKPKAVLFTALSGLPTVIGAMLGYWLGTMGAMALSFSLAFASGAMCYVVFGELLPESILMWKSKLPAVAIMVGIFVGLVIVYV